MAAQRYGILDPATFVARIRKFSQPSEVQEPLELLRAGISFHARGLVNTKAIQHNMDWLWPYWVERQFNPADPSFVPRAFSFSHINLTHRNWTAVGVPDRVIYPIVDPRGMVTPLHDGWSLDFWIITDTGKKLFPSRLEEREVTQKLELEPALQVCTHGVHDGMELTARTAMQLEKGGPRLEIHVEGKSDEDGWIIASVRPYNPEGVQFIHDIRATQDRRSLLVDDQTEVMLSEAPDLLRMAHYAQGDVSHRLAGAELEREVHCEVGMATAAAMFRMKAGQPRSLKVTIDLRDADGKEKAAARKGSASEAWKDATVGLARLRVPDERMQFLYDSAVRTLVLLAADLVVPGPYTYRRFWFRDACLMLHALLAIHDEDRAERIIRQFPQRQTFGGYFESQEGEWDSNGQVLWILARHAAMTKRSLSPELNAAARKAVAWLDRKRLSPDHTSGAGGLLPAGFSAEHLGPNDFYYWDDYWAVGGLWEIGRYWEHSGDRRMAETARTLSKAFRDGIERSLASIPRERTLGAIPAAPGRRMDAGAIGSMVADYPLQLYPAGEPRLAKTLEFLLTCCFHGGGFFQEMIHSGINAYLTLDLAQTLLRAGDPRHAALIRSVAALASPTGQWPEAIHPRTLGGCMGDGQHGWAAAEWIMMMRNCFIREDDHLVIVGSGILPEWLDGSEIGFGPTLTAWGEVTVRLVDHRVLVTARWHDAPGRILIAVPGYDPIPDAASGVEHHLQKASP
ncbi:hypothetical protein KBB96_10070 [Luteolibacter ambystomatis]|uniref:Uncharacterized protein n=1 Tax=Luteolibacter ambystomatis TaxID=2824561 RepID=A0A975J382_9BACT|nr:hypothetical protein [Luteolibacter ambystomatis]QUE53225.1 hypothetical protein KBB96_10070 [Luteolibacter ambystomatis]